MTARLRLAEILCFCLFCLRYGLTNTESGVEANNKSHGLGRTVVCCSMMFDLGMHALKRHENDLARGVLHIDATLNDLLSYFKMFLYQER